MTTTFTMTAPTAPLIATPFVATGACAIEQKADRLEEAFDNIASNAALEELRHSLTALKMRVEQQAIAGARAPLEGTKSVNTNPMHTAFIEKYLRRGLDKDSGVKSLSISTDSAGGYAVPREIDVVIARTLASLSPIRAIATVVQTGSSGYRKLVATGKTASGWRTDIADRPETNSRSFAEIAPLMGELYANPAASQAMLDDAAFDVEAWLVDEIAHEFAAAESAAFITGNGANQPKGFLHYPTSSDKDANRSFGILQHIISGAEGAFATSNPQDNLVDLVHALRPPYRQGAVWMMNSDVLAQIRQMKTSDGAFLWQPGMIEGQTPTLLGYPVVEAEHMPSLAAESLSIAFGNFRAGYLIADRGETALLRDPYSNKPFVHFYATKRVGGALMNSEAIKLMKFSAR